MDLKDGGNKVCLIEKMPFPGGATNLAATYFVAVGTKEQKAAGKFISVDDYVARQKKMLPNVDVDKLKAQMLCSQNDFSQVCERSSQWCELRYSQCHFLKTVDFFLF